MLWSAGISVCPKAFPNLIDKHGRHPQLRTTSWMRLREWYSNALNVTLVAYASVEEGLNKSSREQLAGTGD